MNPEALHKLAYGLYIVGSRKGDQLNAQIANTVFQITSEPPTVAVSINKSNLTYEFIKESGVFSVSILCQDTPLAFIGLFGFRSGRDTDKLQDVNYRLGTTRAPIVTDNAVAYLEAEVVREVDVGTHSVFIGHLVDADVISEATCMTYEYYRQIKHGVAPPAAPTYIAGVKAEAKEAKPEMPKYRCTICGYIYDPELGDTDGGIKPGTLFEQLPETWVCPVCGAGKDQFERI